MSNYKPLILILVTLSFVTQSVVFPLAAYAQTTGPTTQSVGSVIAEDTTCVGAGILAPLLVQWIRQGLSWLSNAIGVGWLKNLLKPFGADKVPILDNNSDTRATFLNLLTRCTAHALLDNYQRQLIGA